ncbi:ABC-type Fe3+-hydroxamate transport system substrate-binding protein [Pseudonocardia hierapolitana]|uniref:ABC-type Fe3+-hydroxamate transport system substrate-binding protein n=1 Tax=Pseudonocardia hierapolitana TaxID=1128676 RepID=A0A561T106_9PSEU|nr:ABC transporter substrate-binding protein [Pseudonocardia hierapolitana]TWF80775.1 ABC-type Fe3+-hydroxamate transport system substrate-binding protein [Pseudonocardia hierapolitana]
MTAPTAPPPLTRRTLLTGAVATVLAGCASGVRGDVPGDRLVTLDGATAALALLLGPHQVGTASFLAVDPLLQAIARIQAGPVADVSGAGGGIDVERLAALQPDRLVGFRTSGTDPVLGELATVHAVERTGDHDADCRALAAGMGVDANALLDDVHRRTAELAARLRAGSPPTVSVLSPGLDGRSLYLLGAGTPAGTVAAALGLPRPAAQRGPTDPATPFVPVSTERITEHDADLVLLLTGPTADPTFLRDEPLWQRLGAVRGGRVVEVDAMRWATMSCALGTLWVLDDLAAVLLGEGELVTGAASPAGLERLRGYRARYAPG